VAESPPSPTSAEGDPADRPVEETTIGQAPPPLIEAESTAQQDEQVQVEQTLPPIAEPVEQVEVAPASEPPPPIEPQAEEAQPEPVPTPTEEPPEPQAEEMPPEEDVPPAEARELPDQEAEEERTFTRPRSLKDLKPGMVLEGKVTSVAIYGVFVDIGVGREGLVHISQLSDRPVSSPTDVVRIGEMVTVRVLDVDARSRRISLTMREQVSSKVDVEKLRALTSGTVLQGTVTSRTRFGLFVDIGVGKDGLVPQSHIVQQGDKAPQTGEQVDVRVLEVDKKAGRIRLSMRGIHDTEQFSSLRPGTVLTGRVASLAPFGAFIDLGVGKDGLVHISEMGDGSIRHPQEILKVGQELEVRIVDVDPETQRISLSLQLEAEEEWVPDWQDEEEEDDLPEGDATLEDLVARFSATRPAGRTEGARTTSHAEKKKRAVREAIQRTLEEMRQQEE
jgi:transcriptional accessory protein Tex/SPT6